MKKLIAILVIMSLLVPVAFAESLEDLFGGMTSLFRSDDESNTYAPGDTAELDDYDITLTNVMVSDGGSQYTPADGYNYIIFEFDIKNKTDEQEFISSMMCFSLSVDGKTYTISFEADAIALFSGKTQLDVAIDPGETVSGVVGYEIPKEWAKLSITVKPDVYGGQKATFVMEK